MFFCFIKFPSKKIRLTKKSPVKHHKWTFEENKAFIEFISIAKTDPKYGQRSAVQEWPSFSYNNKFWDDAARHIQCSTFSNILLSSKLTKHLLETTCSEHQTIELVSGAIQCQ